MFWTVATADALCLLLLAPLQGHRSGYLLVGKLLLGSAGLSGRWHRAGHRDTCGDVTALGDSAGPVSVAALPFPGAGCLEETVHSCDLGTSRTPEFGHRWP